jgi:hypothetical protein
VPTPSVAKSTTAHVENIDIQGPRPPACALTTTRRGLQPLGKPQERDRPSMGIYGDDGIQIAGLEWTTDRCRLIEARDGYDVDTDIRQSHQKLAQRLGRIAPRA